MSQQVATRIETGPHVPNARKIVLLCKYLWHVGRRFCGCPCSAKHAERLEIGGRNWKILRTKREIRNKMELRA